LTAGDQTSAHASTLREGSPLSSEGRKVFHLVDSFNVGGTETQAVELALRLATIGYEVTLGALSAKGPLLDRLKGTSVKVKEFRSRGIDTPSGIYQLLRLSWHLKNFDVVHTHDLWSNLFGVPSARLAGVPAIVSSQRDLSHLDWYQGKRRVWLRRIQNMGGAILTNATPIRDALIAEDGCVPGKLRVIHNGVDIAKFHTGRANRAGLFPGVGEAKLIVLVGNMHSDVKGHRWLIASAPIVVREFPSTRFVLVGDGEKRANFEAQVRDSGLMENFLFLGRRGDIPEILACCDIAVLPSRAEGLPNAVLEYMAAGLPSVVTRVGGNTELVDDGETGLSVPPEDSGAISKALLKLLRDPCMARRLGHAGHEFIVRNFSFERLVREVDALYSDLLLQTGRNH